MSTAGRSGTDPTTPVRTIEFIGATGAGKTTLARRVASIDPEAHSWALWGDLVTDRPGRRWIHDPHLINVLADVAALPAFLPPRARDLEFARFAFGRLRRHAPSTLAAVNYMRNVIRKTGMYRLALSVYPPTIVLFDEGPILTSYQLFVYSGAHVTAGELERFVELVPMPDRIVYVKAPLDVLAQRALGRSDPRRELAGVGPETARAWIRRAVDVFDALSELEPIRRRLRVVEIADGSDESLRDTAEDLVRWIVPIEGRLDAGPTRSADGPSGRGSPSPTLIAFVGSEATGKSTIIDRIDAWLRPHRPVGRIHVGKPPGTPLTWLPHVLLPALRVLFPGQRTVRVQHDASGSRLAEGSFPILFGVRSVMLAYERRAAIRNATRGGPSRVVLCDRYPSRSTGAPDGPQLAIPAGRPPGLVRRALATLERRIYRRVPSPDLVFHLAAPLDVTLARNAARDKREPEEYVRVRHELSERYDFDPQRLRRIDTDRDLDVVVKEIQEVIGGHLGIGR